MIFGRKGTSVGKNGRKKSIECHFSQQRPPKCDVPYRDGLAMGGK